MLTRESGLPPIARSLARAIDPNLTDGSGDGWSVSLWIDNLQVDIRRRAATTDESRRAGNDPRLGVIRRDHFLAAGSNAKSVLGKALAGDVRARLQPTPGKALVEPLKGLRPNRLS